MRILLEIFVLWVALSFTLGAAWAAGRLVGERRIVRRMSGELVAEAERILEDAAQ